MNYDEFLSEVQNLADLGSKDEAEKATRATLATLKERLAGNEPSNLAAQLPGRLQDALAGEGGRDNFSLGEFYDRVAQKEGVGRQEAEAHARAVGTTLQTAVTEGEMEDVRNMLTSDYTDLFGQPGASA